MTGCTAALGDSSRQVLQLRGSPRPPAPGRAHLRHLPSGDQGGPGVSCSPPAGRTEGLSGALFIECQLYALQGRGG